MARAEGLIEPEPLREVREKRVYPPLQWWPLRVMNPWHKLGFLLAYWLGGRLVGLALAGLLPLPVGAILFEVLWDVVMISMARSFRGFGEPVTPKRAWWRLTARPRAGWWLGGLSILGSIHLFMAPLSVVETVQDAGSLVLGLAFLNSSIRLHIERRHPQI